MATISASQDQETGKSRIPLDHKVHPGATIAFLGICEAAHWLVKTDCTLALHAARGG